MVGIVILNYNSWADTVACVDSIHEAEKKLEFRIYLVDNCSPVRPETGVLESLDKKGVIFIQNERNAGYSAGNNIGIKRALEDGCEAILMCAMKQEVYQNCKRIYRITQMWEL